MKNIIKYPLIEVKDYLKLLIILGPLFNFLAGITFDLHAPSLPEIATYYHSSVSAAKNTITVALLGFSIGCILFGVLLDYFGRRSIILFALILYTIASFSALLSGSILQLLLIRFIQGLTVACLSIGSRTIIFDNFKAHQFKVAILYSSLAFGIGPIIAPFIGGFLQYHFGWKANFIGYGVVSFVLFIIFLFFIAESKSTLEKPSLMSLLKSYIDTIKQKHFFPGIIISGLSQVQLLVFTTTGAFMIENILQKSAITYGNSALIISCGYLFGTLTNRLLINNYHVHKLINLGFILLTLGVALQFLFYFIGVFNLFTIVLPLIIIGFSNGFIFINVFTFCLGFSISAGIATSIYTSAIMCIGTIGTYIVSHINVDNLAIFGLIFGISAVIQIMVYNLFLRSTVKRGC